MEKDPQRRFQDNGNKTFDCYENGGVVGTYRFMTAEELELSPEARSALNGKVMYSPETFEFLYLVPVA